MTWVIYLARPIDQADEVAVTKQAGIEVLDFAREAGWTVYQPDTAWDGGPCVPDRRIQQVNDYALSKADGLFALLPAYAKSVGVPMEIERAAVSGIPVAVWRDPNVSWALAAMPPNVRVANDVPYLLRWLQQEMIDNGPLGRFPQAFVVGPGEMPSRSYEGDAGYDLYVLNDCVLEPGSTADIACGVAVQWPEGVWGLLVGRSSTFAKRNLLVNTAIIDNGYRGDLFATVRNLNGARVQIRKGERLAQIIPLPLLAQAIPMARTTKLLDSDRGDRGFGSSGT